ncbi:DNA replication complex subunit Gins51 [Natrarchaeobius oligotrophus]|uniref:Gins51 C-terminal domain-containing protein n=1 Tax=Natrarchaeobius chitinivorans TaxID=1679083 RepID=A0A3N6MH25_NATCH|nr:hypothetical protein [Natrarchaeobius chitinivorans]RQH00345.1 hypothetical protein EA472_10860 [Natrarchaeobius chitinivorans]
MNLDELRSVQSKERKKDSLQHLRPSFYREVGDYIADLEAERDRAAERADDPFSSPEVGRLTDEIETAKDVVEAVYERRMGKLVKQASLAAAGMQADDEGLTAEEADLFDDLVDRIESNKTRVLDVLEGIEESGEPGPGGDNPVAAARADERRAAGEANDVAGASPERTVEPSAPDVSDDPPPPPLEPDAPDQTASNEPTKSDGSSGVSAADVMGGDRDPTDGSNPTPPDTNDGDVRPTEPAETLDGSDGKTTADGSAGDSDGPGAGESDGEPTGDSDGVAAAESDVDRVTVKITRDVGSILGVDDREYTLSADDVVTLPEQNATPLVDREAAEQLE